MQILHSTTQNRPLTSYTVWPYLLAAMLLLTTSCGNDDEPDDNTPSPLQDDSPADPNDPALNQEGVTVAQLQQLLTQVLEAHDKARDEKREKEMKLLQQKIEALTRATENVVVHSDHLTKESLGIPTDKSGSRKKTNTRSPRVSLIRRITRALSSKKKEQNNTHTPTLKNIHVSAPTLEVPKTSSTPEETS